VDSITHATTAGCAVIYGAMARPASITATSGMTTHWSTGTYDYDGAGNVTEIGNSYFLYDSVSRPDRGIPDHGSPGNGLTQDPDLHPRRLRQHSNDASASIS